MRREWLNEFQREILSGLLVCIGNNTLLPRGTSSVASLNFQPYARNDWRHYKWVKSETIHPRLIDWFFGVLTPLSTIFQLYRFHLTIIFSVLRFTVAELTSLVSSIISGTGSNISTYNGSPTITSSKLLPITGCYKAYYVIGRPIFPSHAKAIVFENYWWWCKMTCAMQCFSA
jgi:hypothetical protein